MINRYLKIFFVCCLAIFLAASVYGAESDGDIEARIKALEKKIQKAADVEAIKGVMASMQFHVSMMSADSSKTPGKCFGQNEGYEYGSRMGGGPSGGGPAGTSDAAPAGGTQPGRGNMPGNPTGEQGGSSTGLYGQMQSNLDFHILTTAVIEVADDGQSAKAVWYSPGILSEGSAPNWMTAWIYELYACDFVKEDGVWKSWHRTLSTDFMTSPSKSWTESWSAAVSNTDVSRISAILDSTKTGEYNEDVRMRNVQGGGQTGAPGEQAGAPPQGGIPSGSPQGGMPGGTGGMGVPPGGQGGTPPQGGMPPGGGMPDGAGGQGGPPPQGGMPGGTGGQGGPPGGGMGEGKDITGVFYQSWTETTMPQFKPKPPEPYSTFTETFSYCPAMPVDLAEEIYPDQLDTLKSLNMLAD